MTVFLADSSADRPHLMAGTLTVVFILVACVHVSGKSVKSALNLYETALICIKLEGLACF